MNAVELQRLDHVSLNVADRPRSIGWYRDVLGLEQGGEPREDDWPVFMGEPGACIALFQAQARSPERQQESTGLRHVAFTVDRDGLARAKARLAERDVPFRWEDHGSADSLYVDDPDGNVIELTAYKR
jgi:catechol-2,3-dioxygenase